LRQNSPSPDRSNNSRLTIFLPYKLDTTKDLLISRAGLLVIADLMETLRFDDHIDQHVPQPNSNRGFHPSDFIKARVLMQHEGSYHLDDIRHVHDDEALRTVLTLETSPRPPYGELAEKNKR
jgi:hypothetical protein